MVWGRNDNKTVFVYFNCNVTNHLTCLLVLVKYTFHKLLNKPQCWVKVCLIWGTTWWLMIFSWVHFSYKLNVVSQTHCEAYNVPSVDSTLWFIADCCIVMCNECWASCVHLVFLSKHKTSTRGQSRVLCNDVNRCFDQFVLWEAVVKFHRCVYLFV